MYLIKIHYITGDSFHSEETSDDIGHEWKSLEVAKENLQRIKNHHEWLKENSEHNKPCGDLPPGVAYSKEFNHIMFALLTDKGEQILVWSFWTGYFERLLKAEICLFDNDMVFVP